jgi:SOS response regulatory protein OraA/RecX
VRDEDAFGVALRLLHHRDYAVRDLEQRLTRRGHAPDEVERALGRLRESGLVDDERYASARASSLASRGAGDELIRRDLERSGVARERVEDALAAIEPEHERAGQILGRRGASLRTARYLRSKGFDEEVVQALVANAHEGELG